MADKTLTLPMEPPQAIEFLNGHDHTGGLGNQISTDGVADQAITEVKLADASVSSRTIQAGAVGLTILSSDVREQLAANGSEGVPGLTNFIAEGLKFQPGNALSIKVKTGRASIGEKTVKLTADQEIALEARMACLMYAMSQTESTDPVIGKINAVLPEPDDNTVGQWRFNLNGDQDVPNYAVGKSAIAVANNLVHHGGLTKVDGYTDYAIQGDGSTGYFTSANSTNFPLASAVREINVLFTAPSTPSIGQTICYYGGITTTNGSVVIYETTSGTLAVHNTSNIWDTSFAFTAGQTYLITVQYDGVNLIVFVNGVRVYSGVMPTSTVAGNLTVLGYDNSSYIYGKGIISFIELRNALRSSKQISDVANALLLPNRYYTPQNEEYINGVKLYDIATPENAISGGDYSGYPKGNSADKNIAAVWASSQTYTSISGVAYIGQKVLSKIKHIRLTTNAATVNNISSVLVQYSIDNGVTWTTIQTQTLATTVSYANDFDITDYTVSGTHYIRLLANANTSSSGNSWCVAEVNTYTDVQPTKFTDIRSILPSNSIALGFVRTNSSGIIAYNDSDYGYGRREKACGGNRRAFLGWKYFSAGSPLTIDNILKTDNISVSEIWFKKYVADVKHSVIDVIYVSSSNTYYGSYIKEVSPLAIKINSVNGYIVDAGNSYTGSNESTGFIGLWAKVQEDD